MKSKPWFKYEVITFELYKTLHVIKKIKLFLIYSFLLNVFSTTFLKLLTSHSQSILIWLVMFQTIFHPSCSSHVQLSFRLLQIQFISQPNYFLSKFLSDSLHLNFRSLSIKLIFHVSHFIPSAYKKDKKFCLWSSN